MFEQHLFNCGLSLQVTCLKWIAHGVDINTFLERCFFLYEDLQWNDWFLAAWHGLIVKQGTQKWKTIW